MTIIDLSLRSRPAEQPGPALNRVRTVIESLDLGCECKARLATALDRFSVLEDKRARREALTAARGERERIALLLQLLAELDEIPLAEPDGSVYRELEFLFRDVAAAAERGAQAVARATQS
ncbi:hypothetical protein ACTZWW_12195 [Salinarimonas sp. NSM]|uniref:hypothetical protein n=1 Tax=Salinarimonas sp. NSM TaxID=3458003 RepID=UPI004036D043